MKAVVSAIALSLAVAACHSQSASKPSSEDVKSLQRQLAKDGALYVTISELVARRLLIHGGDDVVIHNGGEALVVGKVMVGFEIDKSGNVRCSTALAGPEMLKHAATSAVAKWKFKPYQLNGENIAVSTSVHVLVTLEPHGDH
jgi:hypothetical protein